MNSSSPLLARGGGGVCLRCARTALRTYATEQAPAPPLLLKLRRDLKTAMQSKDANRLNVLRGVLADITNATKSGQTKSMQNDVQILAILRKRAADSKRAAQEFGDAGRADLVDKETGQIAVLDEYAGTVETIGEEEIRTRVGEVVTELAMADADSKKSSKGLVLKKLLGPGGVFEGKPVEKSTVTKMVDLALGQA